MGPGPSIVPGLGLSVLSKEEMNTKSGYPKCEACGAGPWWGTGGWGLGLTFFNSWELGLFEPKYESGLEAKLAWRLEKNVLGRSNRCEPRPWGREAASSQAWKHWAHGDRCNVGVATGHWGLCSHCVFYPEGSKKKGSGMIWLELLKAQSGCTVESNWDGEVWVAGGKLRGRPSREAPGGVVTMRRPEAPEFQRDVGGELQALACWHYSKVITDTVPFFFLLVFCFLNKI